MNRIFYLHSYYSFENEFVKINGETTLSETSTSLSLIFGSCLQLLSKFFQARDGRIFAATSIICTIYQACAVDFFFQVDMDFVFIGLIIISCDDVL